ncbi:MAG: sensor histidine kinase [Faecousia sp.]
MFKKLTIYFFVIILLVTLVFTLAFAHYSNGVISQDVLDAYQISAESISNQCDNYIIQLQNDLLSLAIDSSIQDALHNFTPGDAVGLSALRLPAHSLTVQGFPLIGQQLYSPDENGLYMYQETLSSEPWVRNTISRGGRVNLAAVEIGETRYIRLSIMVTDMTDWQTPIGILATDIPLDNFVMFIGKSSLSSSDYMILMDQDGAIQYPYHPSAALAGEKIQVAIDQGNYTESGRIFLSAPIARSSWHLVLSYSTSSIQARTVNLYRTAAVIAVIAVVTSCLVALLLSWEHSIPIINLTKHIQNGTYLQPIDVPRKLNRDYLSLYKNYNKMVEQINSLMDEVYETNKRERETQLKMLQAQINPHFIYNVLDSISWLSMKYQAKDIQMMVSSLATMLRCSLNSGRDILNVHQEIRQIQSYLRIQAYRYDNAIHVQYDFSPEIMDKKMIKLLLQPLVENAIVHGLETFDGEKHLKVCGYLKDQMLVFEVCNNGIPPDLDRIQQILSGSQQVTTSYGIRNVNERIKAAYGSQYGLRYEIRGEWIVANITVPCEPI